MKLSSIHKELENKHIELLKDYEDLILEFKTLQSELREKEEKYASLVNEYNRLQDKYNSLESRYSRLEIDYSKLSTNYTLLLTNLALLGVNIENIDELWKLREAMITRTYLIYDYDECIWKWYFWHWLLVKWYFHERTKIIHELMTLEDRVAKYSEELVRQYIHHPLISKIADFLGRHLKEMKKNLLITYSNSYINYHIMKHIMLRNPLLKSSSKALVTVMLYQS